MAELPMTAIATVHTDHRITVPVWLRDEFDIEPGDQLVLDVKEVEKA